MVYSNAKIKEFKEIVQVQYFFEQREKELPRFAVLNEQLMSIIHHTQKDS